MANALLGTDFVEYTDKPWADYPIPMVLALAGAGALSGIEEIMSTAGNIAELADQATESPEAAAKLYIAMSALRATLEKIAKKRRNGEEVNLRDMTGNFEELKDAAYKKFKIPEGSIEPAN